MASRVTQIAELVQGLHTQLVEGPLDTPTGISSTMLSRQDTRNADPTRTSCSSVSSKPAAFSSHHDLKGLGLQAGLVPSIIQFDQRGEGDGISFSTDDAHPSGTSRVKPDKVYYDTCSDANLFDVHFVKKVGWTIDPSDTVIKGIGGHMQRSLGKVRGVNTHLRVGTPYGRTVRLDFDVVDSGGTFENLLGTPFGNHKELMTSVKPEDSKLRYRLCDSRTVPTGIKVPKAYTPLLMYSRAHAAPTFNNFLSEASTPSVSTCLMLGSRTSGQLPARYSGVRYITHRTPPRTHTRAAVAAPREEMPRLAEADESGESATGSSSSEDEMPDLFDTETDSDCDHNVPYGLRGRRLVILTENPIPTRTSTAAPTRAVSSSCTPLPMHACSQGVSTPMTGWHAPPVVYTVHAAHGPTPMDTSGGGSSTAASSPPRLPATADAQPRHDPGASSSFTSMGPAPPTALEPLLAEPRAAPPEQPMHTQAPPANAPHLLDIGMLSPPWDDYNLYQGIGRDFEARHGPSPTWSPRVRVMYGAAVEEAN